MFLHSPFCRAEWLCQQTAIKGEVEGMLRNMSCDWSMQISLAPIGQNLLRPGWRTGSTVHVYTSSVQH